MRRMLLLLLVFCSLVSSVWAGGWWAVVVTTDNAETAWNAMRVARFAQKQGEQVKVFFLGRGVRATMIEEEPFNVKELLEEVAEEGGEIHACRACLRLHHLKPSETCPAGNLKTLYQIIAEAEKVLIF